MSVGTCRDSSYLLPEKVLSPNCRTAANAVFFYDRSQSAEQTISTNWYGLKSNSRVGYFVDRKNRIESSWWSRETTGATSTGFPKWKGVA